MLRDSKGMPRMQEIADAASIAKYGGRRMLLAPPLDYDALMRQVPPGRLTTVGLLRQQLAERYGFSVNGMKGIIKRCTTILLEAGAE